jgi:hypothetical protein
MATRNRGPATMKPAADIRDNLPLTDPGLLLKEKIRAAEAAAQQKAQMKDALTDPGLALMDKVQSGNKIPKGPATSSARRSALTSIGPTPATTSSSKPSTQYKIRSKRTVSLSDNSPSAPPLEVWNDKPKEELTEQQQQERDLFDEDQELFGPPKPVYTPQLTESEMEARSVEQLESYAILKSQVCAVDNSPRKKIYSI